MLDIQVNRVKGIGEEITYCDGKVVEVMIRKRTSSSEKYGGEIGMANCWYE